jgi:hypothetical protein
VFALPIATDVHIEITPFRAGEPTDGGHLDVAADILNAAGVVVATVDDVHETASALTVDLPSTPHFLRGRPSFDPANYPAYASLGGYTVVGTFVRAVELVGFQEPLVGVPKPTTVRGSVSDFAQRWSLRHRAIREQH